ncbi:N-acetylmuramoyl-L-alanine amidase [Emcibacter sp. SYSU 3D8]|uniref:N-acetylmuramoyl-L-alanine amidase n=1 Tax=Emcibacter sp. SYSU 3D8 TaxID=3133969 RepID=UPI0031FE545A
MAFAQPSVTGVRIGAHPDSTRFVLDVSENIAVSVFTLADPYRVVIDMPALDWKVGDGGQGEAGETQGLVERYRFGLFQQGNTRLVLDLRKPAVVRQAFVLPPQGAYGYRFVVDLEATDRARFMKTVQSPPAAPASPPAAIQSAPQKRGDSRRTVAIDAGHGGVDPGTISGDGTYEKSVTLSVALELKRQLERTGRYNVIATRQNDIFIPLGERVEIGRRGKADLFISLHADSIANGSIRGSTVYTLSETASDKEAAALASKENKADIIAGVDLGKQSPEVTGILIDLMQRETMNYSIEFARLLIPKLEQAAEMRDNPHRFAGFRVLKAPDVPSVLVEMGYLSNAQDTRYLKSARGQREIAAAIAASVDGYFQRHDARLSAQ